MEERSRIGDYERDSIVSSRNNGGLLTIVDRFTRLVRIGKVERTASLVTHHKTIDLIQGLKLNTITNDSGAEFALSDLTEQILGIKIYFSHPYCSWERGTNENTNGLIRQYFPKKTDFHQVRDKDIDLVERAINTRPRKCLSFKTPLEVYNEQCENKLYVKDVSAEEINKLEFLLNNRGYKKGKKFRFPKQK